MKVIAGSLFVLMSISLAHANLSFSARTKCFIAEEEDYLTSQLFTDGSNFFQSWTAFEDEKCEIPYLEVSRHYQITSFAIQNLDLVLFDVTYTPKTKETAEALKEIRYCGIQIWEKDIPTSVVGLKCDGSSSLKTNHCFIKF